MGREVPLLVWCGVVCGIKLGRKSIENVEKAERKGVDGDCGDE